MSQKLSKIKNDYGAWTAHNIHLGDGEYTITKDQTGDTIKLNRILQSAGSLLAKPLDEARVLDLACLEGLYATEFALQGADVVAVEGREQNLAKAKFTKEKLGLDNIAYEQNDVRNIKASSHGTFDVVLCLGLLYHIDAEHIATFIQQMRDLTNRLLIIDTHVAHTDQERNIYADYKTETTPYRLSEIETIEYNGIAYYGRNYIEHQENASEEEKKNEVWASLDNNYSFWFTKPSLLKLLGDLGFASVFETLYPYESDKPFDRRTFIAIKNDPYTIKTFPGFNDDMITVESETQFQPTQADQAGSLSKKLSRIFK